MCLSLLGYTYKALKHFNHTKKKNQNQPYPSAPIIYGAKKIYETQPSAALLLEKNKYPTSLWKFLFLGIAIDSTLLCPISDIASQSATPNKETMRQTHQLLDYIAIQEDAVTTYTSSHMKLAVHGDASTLSEPKARIRAGRHLFLSKKSTITQNNGAIINMAHIIKHIITSATESELATLYIMSRKAVYIRIILE